MKLSPWPWILLLTVVAIAGNTLAAALVPSFVELLEGAPLPIITRLWDGCRSWLLWLPSIRVHASP